MENRKNNAVVTFSLAVAFVFLLSSESADGLQLHQATDAALEEMSNVLRTLFPLMPPEQTHYFWKTNHLGTATVQRTTSLKSSNLDSSDVSAAESRFASPRTLPPWIRFQINYNKRGPDCMRKCINQGVLHPLQCHSLC